MARTGLPFDSARWPLRTTTAVPSIGAGLLRTRAGSPLSAAWSLGRGPGLVIAAAVIGVGAGVVTDWLRWRTIDVVGIVVIGGIALSIVLALASDDPAIVLLESAAVTTAFGVACLGSLTRRRPLIFHFAQAFYGGPHSASGGDMDEEFDAYEEARSYWRIVTATWGVTYLIEAVAKAVVARSAPIETALALNRTLPWLVWAALMAWSVWWGNRLRALKPGVDPDDEGQ